MTRIAWLGLQLYAETFRLDDLEHESDVFITYQVPQAATNIGRPPSPKYTHGLKRGGTLLTAERTKSFLEGLMDKQVNDLRLQTLGVGNFDKGATSCSAACVISFSAAYASLSAVRQRCNVV